jgi:hypothetical protein
VCVLEDGTPLVRVMISSLVGEERAKGSGAFSGPSGEFRIERPGGTEFEAMFPYSELVAVEGGTILEKTKILESWIFRAEGTTVHLVYRDRAGTAHVRLVNADTNAPVTNVAGLRVAYLFRAGSLSYGVAADEGFGGWIPIAEGRLPEVGPDAEGKERDVARLDIDLSKVEVEFAMPGFEKGRLPLKDIRGRMELRVRPVPADATGEVGIVIPRGDGEILGINSRIRSTVEAPADAGAGVVGLPGGLGPFALYDLPDGSWEIEVAATLAGGSVVRAKKSFEKHGAPVDLGKIELRASGAVAICVMDSESKPIPQAWAVIVRSEENPDQGRRLDLDERGVARLGDLEPGASHRVIVKGLPREMEQAAVAVEKPRFLEFRWPERLVPCRITLLVDGKAVANADGKKTIPAVVQDSPLPRDKGAWGSDGTFEAKLVPGTYKFSALATPKEGGDLALFAGEVTVPAGDAFETRLELRREGR